MFEGIWSSIIIKIDIFRCTFKSHKIKGVLLKDDEIEWGRVRQHVPKGFNLSIKIHKMIDDTPILPIVIDNKMKEWKHIHFHTRLAFGQITLIVMEDQLKWDECSIDHPLQEDDVS